jgi:hypothetical protein
VEKMLTPKGFATVENLIKSFDICPVTAYEYVKSLPEDMRIKQLISDNTWRYLISEEAVEGLRQYKPYFDKDNVISLANLASLMGIHHGTLHLFIVKSGYYEKSIRIGKKKRKYYRICFTKDIAEQIINEWLDPPVYVYKAKLDDYVCRKYRTQRLVDYVKSQVDCIESEGKIHFPTTTSINKILNDYMTKRGFVQTPELQNILNVSRQRVHQILLKIQDDHALCRRLKKSSSIYVHKSVIKYLLERKTSHKGYASLVGLCFKFKIKMSELKEIESKIKSTVFENEKYYCTKSAQFEIDNYHMQNPELNFWISMKALCDKLRHTREYVTRFMKEMNLYNENYIKPKCVGGKQLIVNPSVLQLIQEKKITPIKTRPIMETQSFSTFVSPMIGASAVYNTNQFYVSEEWMNMSNVSKILGISNNDLKRMLKEKNMDNSNYIKTKNGSPNGKAMIVNPVVIDLLKS